MGPSGDMGDAGDNIMIQVGASARSGRKSLFPEPLSAQEFCHGKLKGKYADPSDETCRYYYYCKYMILKRGRLGDDHFYHTHVSREKCPTGTYFNREKERCMEDYICPQKLKSEDDKMSILSVNYLRKGDSIYYYTLSGAVVLLLVSAACGAIWLCRKQVKLKKVEDGFSVPAPATLF